MFLACQNLKKNFFQGQFLNSEKLISDYDIKNLRLVGVFEFNPLQRVSF